MNKRARKSVSVVLATYNGAKYLEQQMNSIANQTLAPLELIVSDDGSIDNTLEIVERLSAGFRFPVRVNCNPAPLGFRDNFLQASLLADGDFVAFCDQDDIWHPTKLEKCSEFFEDRNVSLIVHAARLIDETSEPIAMFRQGIETTRLRAPLSYDPWSTFWGFSMVFRRELLRLVSIRERFIDYIVPSEQIAHDRWIMLLGQMVGSTVEIKDALVDYRQHSNNLFGATSRRGPESIESRSAVYIEATSQMISVLERVAVDAVTIFPLFDKLKCRLFLESALEQLKSRHKIYESPTRAEAVRHLWECLSTQNYRSVNDGSMRWFSLIRDAQFAILRS
jgi:glycosyltransferase involved in cell wall biosynthesis